MISLLSVLFVLFCLGITVVLMMGAGILLFGMMSGSGSDDPLLDLASLLNESPFVVVDDEDDRDITEAETAIINALGRKMVFGTPEEIVSEGSGHLPSATGAFRESLLNQIGGAQFMAEQYADARDSYQAVVDDRPNDKRLLGNLAEAEAKLGHKKEVYALVDRFLALKGKLDADRVSELKVAIEAKEDNSGS